MTIPLVARRAFVFQRPTGGQLTCRAGERVEVTPIEAVLLRARGDAEFAPAASSSPVPPPQTAPRPKRRYRRRDLAAEE
jgi:hypothetical protein